MEAELLNHVWLVYLVILQLHPPPAEILHLVSRDLKN